MKVLIVDDEKPARERLADMLRSISGYEVCGQAGNGVEALQLAARCHPDIVLMDIRMPAMDGLEAARHLGQLEEPPAVIFTTAYGEHALEAFETQAVGYLLKPIREERLALALANARIPNRAQMAGLAMGDDHGPTARSHICARLGGSLELVAIEHIVFFQADQKYVTVRHRDGEVIIEDSLRTLEEEFEPRFLRIHRNALVAKACVQGMDKTADGRFHIVLTGADERLEISRRHVAEVRRFLKTR